MSIDALLHQLTPGLIDIYGNLVDRIILYGSVARGTQTDESDVDVAVLLKSGATREMYEQLLDLVVDLELESGKALSVVRIDYDKFQEWKDVMPFYKNIQREGVLLWQAA